MQHTFNFNSFNNTLKIAQTKAKINIKNITHAFSKIKNELKNTIKIIQQFAINIQQNSNTAKKVKAVAKKVIKVSKATIKIVKEIKNKKLQK